MDVTTQTYVVLLLLAALVISTVARLVIRRRTGFYPLRPIGAYQRLPMAIGAAIEANRPVHLSLGSAGIGGKDTPLALATADLAYHTLRAAAIGDAPPLITMSNGAVLPLAQDTLRRAYASRGMLARYPRGSAQWYPQGARSLAFAAALTGVMTDNRVLINVLGGSFGPEMALPAEAAARHRQQLFASSDQLEGQAVAYALADQPLLGEELYVAGAYLGNEPSRQAMVITLDTLRLALVAVLAILVLVSVAEPVLRGLGIGG
ncbi:MAG TPA: hypothetical protein PLQ56_13265 [Aggregatilineales bacterium]|nr:hypothetical protein [Aggregatilineales bacterium]